MNRQRNINIKRGADNQARRKKQIMYRGGISLLITAVVVSIFVYNQSRTPSVNETPQSKQIIKANRALERSDYIEAIKLSDQVLTKDSLNATAHYMQSQSYLNVNDTTQFRISLRAFLGVATTQHEWIYQSGKSSMSTNDYHLAVNAFNKVNKIKPTDSAYYFLGDLYAHHILNYKEGIINLRSCMILNPEFESSYLINFNMGYCYLQQEKYEMAREWFVKSIELSPQFAEPIYYLAKTHYMLGDTEFACDLWYKASSLDSDLAELAIEKICQ